MGFPISFNNEIIFLDISLFIKFVKVFRLIRNKGIIITKMGII